MEEKIKVVLSKVDIIEMAFEGTSIRNAVSVTITNNNKQNLQYNTYFVFKNGDSMQLTYIGSNKNNNPIDKKSSILDGIINKYINGLDSIIEYYNTDNILFDSEIQAIVVINNRKDEYKSNLLILNK